MLKFCNSCKTEKPLENFSFKSKEKGTRHSKCKVCHRVDSNNHYKKNVEYYSKRASQNKKRIREWWQEYKKQFKCPCGESHPACIEFHHTDNNKENDVSYLINNGMKKKAMEEMGKCIPICSNCHRKLHYELKNNKK